MFVLLVVCCAYSQYLIGPILSKALSARLPNSDSTRVTAFIGLLFYHLPIILPDPSTRNSQGAHQVKYCRLAHQTNSNLSERPKSRPPHEGPSPQPVWHPVISLLNSLVYLQSSPSLVIEVYCTPTKSYLIYSLKAWWTNCSTHSTSLPS